MEMLRRQYAVDLLAAAMTTNEPAGSGKMGGEQPAATVHSATSSAVRPGDELAITGAVCAAVEKKTTSTIKSSSRDREPTSGKSLHSTTASKRERERTESQSPGSERKRSASGGTYGLTAELRESEAKWQDRAVRAEEDLRRLQHRYNVLEKDQKSAKTQWESERTQLVADKSTA
jgi:flagellar motility protein MotE (MotC chaperone)